MHLRAALKLEPDNLDGLANLAWLLATSPESSARNGAEAIQLAQRANELSGERNPLVLRALAAAYAETGRFDDAVSAAQRALALLQESSNNGLANQLRAEIQLYNSRFPYREKAR